jgi:hypothetical protein
MKLKILPLPAHESWWSMIVADPPLLPRHSRKAGFEVEQAINGMEAIERFGARSIW